VSDFFVLRVQAFRGFRTSWTTANWSFSRSC